MPARAPSAASRAGTSAAAFAWSVAIPPRWPVLSAVRTSRTSGPRHSPRTILSGRIRSASRTSRDTSMAPAPSTFDRRSTSRTTCGWSGLTSPASSMTTIRSEGSTRDRRLARRVVFPLPVAPVMRSDARPATRPASTSASPGASVPHISRSWRVRAPRRTVLRAMDAHPSTTGGRAAWSRVPSGSRASTRGLASSSRLPAEGREAHRELADVGRGAERDRRALQPEAPVDPDLTRAVDEHVGDARRLQKGAGAGRRRRARWRSRTTPCLPPPKRNCGRLTNAGKRRVRGDLGTPECPHCPGGSVRGRSRAS